MLDSATVTLLMNKFVIGVLFFVRVSALMATAPAFSHSAVQAQTKIFLGAILAAGMTSAFGHEQPPITLELWNLVVLVFKEFLVGALIGFSASIIFKAARFAGGLIDMDMGFQTALIFDQNADVPTLSGELLSMVALMVFLMINGHHFLIEAMYLSIRAVPISTFSMPDATIEQLVRMTTTMMMIGLKIASPVLVSLFMTNLALGLLSRIAPQVNIFVLSFNFKVVIGMLVMAFSIPLFVVVIRHALQLMQDDVMKVVISINKF